MKKTPALTKATQLTWLHDYTVAIEFNDGTAGEVNLEPLLVGEAVEYLRDPAKFQQLTLGPTGQLEWPDDMQFSARNARRLLLEQR